jgi:hypothetical protein
VCFNPQEWGTTLLIYLMAFTPFFYNTNLSIKKDSAQMRTLVVAFFIIWNVFLYLCFTTCIEIPNLARMMTSDRGSYSSIINGGGYYMGYGSSILTTYLYSKLIWGEFRKPITRLAIVLEIFFMIATILVINSYIILISMVAGIVVASIDRIARTAQSQFFSYFIASILLLILLFNYTGVLKFLSGTVSNEFWNSRIVETYESAVFSEDSDHVGERERVYQISIDGFFKSPLFGNGYKNGNVYEGEGHNNIGNHSTVLDSLSQFGIIGSIPLFLFLLYPLRKRRRDGGAWVHLVPFLVMAFLNPVLKCYHVMLILFLIIPSLEVITKERNQRTVKQ